MEEKEELFQELIKNVEDYPNILSYISDFSYRQYILAGSGKNIYIWPYNTLDNRNKIIDNGKIIHNIFTTIGKELFFITEHSGRYRPLGDDVRLTMNNMCYNMKIYNADTGLMVHDFLLQDEEIVKIIVSPNLKYFAKLTYDTITIVKTSDNSVVDTITFDQENYIVASFSYDSNLFIYTQIESNPNILLYTLNINTLERGQIHTSIMDGRGLYLNKILITPNQIILQLNINIYVLNFQGIPIQNTNNPLHYQDITYIGYMTSINISPNQKRIVYGFQDTSDNKWSIRIINLSDFSSEFIRNVHPTKIGKVIFINDDIIASSSNDKTIKIHDIYGSLIKTLEHDQYVQTLNYLFISNIEELLLSSMMLEESIKDTSKPKGNKRKIHKRKSVKKTPKNNKIAKNKRRSK